MASVTSINPGIADLLQTFSNSGSAAISSAFSSPSVQSALQHASPGDVVHLSLAALQLQEVGGLFGNSVSPQTAPTQVSLLLQALGSSLAGPTTPGSTTVSLFG